MKRTFLFYDIETSGLNESFDQLVQFAGIRTDENLNILKTYNILVRLRPDVVPSPEAQVTHRIPIKRLLSEGISEYEAAKRTHGLLNEPGTTSIGYNNMRFDGPVLRFTFYRNLLHPYTHQYQNGCAQMDVLPMLIACYNSKPHLLKWPNDHGGISFKLSSIAKENGFVDSGDVAHNAISDVKMLLKIVRVLKADDDLWNYLCGFFNQHTDKERLLRLPVVCKSKIHGMSPIDHTQGIVLSPKYKNANCQASVLYIGDSIPYQKQGLWLKIDDPDFQDLTKENIPDRAVVIRKKIGGPDFILPPDKRFCALPPERIGLAEKNLKWLLDQPELLSDIVRYFREFRFPSPSALDPDTALYGMPFLCDRELNTNNLFHEAPTAGEKAGIKFTRPAYAEIAKRILWRNFDTPTVEAWNSFLHFMQKPNSFDYKGREKMSVSEALKQIDLLRLHGNLDSEQVSLLDELESYIDKTIRKAMGAGLDVLKKETPGVSSSFEWFLKKYWDVVSWFLARQDKSVAKMAA